MKKIILLIIPILLCGCEAKYKIVLDNNRIHDEIKITEKSSIVNKATDEETNAFADKLLEGERGYEYYSRELITENDQTGYLYTYDFQYDEYSETSQISKCYNDFNITNKDTISINTSDEFLCIDYYENFEKVEIIIESNYKVIKTNADKEDGNKQIWIVNKNNASYKPIIVEFDKNQTNTKSSKNIVNLLVILALAIILIIINKTILKKDKNK